MDNISPTFHYGYCLYMHKPKSSFKCSPNTTFIPDWVCHPLDSSVSQTHLDQNTIFIIPRHQPSTKKLLQSILPDALIIALDDRSSITVVERQINENSGTRIIFVCETPWQHAIDEQAFTLFLTFIQSLANSNQNISFDLITIKAAYNPYGESTIHPFDSVYIGLTQTLAKEFAHWSVRIFNLDTLNKKNIGRIQYHNFMASALSPIHIVGENYYTCGLSPIEFEAISQHSAFKQSGTYLVIGGNGGIGTIMAEYLLKHYQAKLILVGRSEPTEQQKNRYRGQDVKFERVDMTSSEAVVALFSRHPHINGIIHSALVLDDAAITTMKPEQLLSVLAPKVSGTLNLIQAIRHRSLDFVLFFSSIQSFISNAGQANYTAACACKDAMSYLLNDIFLINSKVINWGYWGQVGVVANDFYRHRMEQLEIGSIEKDEGMRIIEQFLQSDARQIAVVKGSRNALKRLGINESDNLPEEIPGSTILPQYNPHSPSVRHNSSAADALENYTRYRFHQISLPSTVIPRYKQFKDAVTSISIARSPNKETLLVTYPELAPHIKLLEDCLANLPGILSGQIDALSILFPNGSFELVEPIYRNNPIADYYNQQVAKTLVNYLSNKSNQHNKPIRILEIGAGTGGTSQIVVPAICKANISYHYSDLSMAFLNKARRTFSQYDFLHYEIYNAEKPYHENDYFDVVIATNVIHATGNIHNTVNNIYNLLSDDGIVVLNEVTQRQDFATLTFGLTEGWWLGNEEFRISNSPLLDINAWRDVLTQCRFEDIQSHGEEGQHVIVGHVGKKTATKPVAIHKELESNVVKAQTKASSIDLIVKTWLMDLISTVMHLPPEEIEGDAPFSQYGIDSLIMLELIRPMRNKLGYVPATLLFEYPTLNQLVAYFSEEHKDKFDDEIQTPNLDDENNIPLSLPPVSLEEELNDDIAIIGIAGQFPMADDCESLWSLLKNGANAYQNIPAERWSSNHDHESYTIVGAFINEIDIFDHAFFNITPIEAEKMDPQERLFLQTVYKAVQDAGLSLDSLSGTEVGCYVGVMNHGYSLLTPEHASQGNPSSLFWSIANRVSYIFNWRGPSFAIDSACSSSLTALHTAIAGLKNHDCDAAVVGGVNLIVHPRQYEDLCQLHMLSASGKCQPFADGSDGFVDGEGVTCIVIKRYKDAIRNQDTIYGVIRGSAINSGGKSNGYTAPNPDAQAAIIKKALQRARLNTNDIGYIEAHGTGTQLGDPIEVRGITKAFGSQGTQKIAMGSIKGNLGHLESAAGLTSVIKVLLQMKHKMLVPSIHCETENKHLQINESPVYINKVLTPWPSTLPMRACVSSFGAGGANAHVIIEGHANQHIHLAVDENQYYLFPISAHSEQSLQSQIDELRQYVQSHDVNLAQISYGYCCVRSHKKYRIGFIANNKATLLSELKTDLQQQYSLRGSVSINYSSVDMLSDYLRGSQKDLAMARSIINAYINGADISFDQLFADKLKPELPGYVFDKHHHWVHAKETNIHRENTLISHHNILGRDMAPAAYAITRLIEEANCNVMKSMTWKNVITDLSDLALQVDGDQFQLMNKHSGLIYCEGATQNAIHEDHKIMNSHHEQREFLSGGEIYQRFLAAGYRYGRDYQAIKWAEVGIKSVRTLIQSTQDWGYKLSPSVIDAGLQMAILLSTSFTLRHSEIMVPYSIDKISIYRLPANEPIYCTCYQTGQSSDLSASYDIEFSDVNSRILFTLQGVLSVKTCIDNLFNITDNLPPKVSVNVYQLN